MTNNLSVYNGPERSYPRKTFPSGEKNPKIVREELLQIPDYLDFTVFSKNQLRFAERLFRTNTYINQENYIRSENFFIKLDKPRYWNYDNIAVLFNNIRIVLDITNEMFKDVINDADITIAKNSINAVTTIISNLKKGFSEISIQNTDFINYLKGLSNSTSINSIFFNNGIVDILNESSEKTGVSSISTEYIFATQIVITIYAKVVSILTYVNPYVLVKKDSGVNTITPPTLKNKNISIPRKQRTAVDGKLSKFMELDMNNYDNNVEYIDQKLKSITPRHKGSKPGTGKITREISNPYIRLIQFPCYSLNILLPIAIAPVIFIFTGAANIDFKVISSHLAELKVVGSYFRININSFLSKLIFYDKNEVRCTPNLVFFKDQSDKEKVKLKMKKGKVVNFEYYRLLKAIAPQHAYYDGVIQQKITTLVDFKAKELTEPEKAALADAESYIPTYSATGTEKVHEDKRYHPNNVPKAKVYSYNDYVVPVTPERKGDERKGDESGYESSSFVEDSEEQRNNSGPKPPNSENKITTGKRLTKKVYKNGKVVTGYYYENNPSKIYDKQGNDITMEVESLDNSN